MIGGVEPYLVGPDRDWDGRPVESRARILLRSCGVELDGRWFVACGKPDCERAVPEGVRFCCQPCAVAAEKRCEIDRHSVSCDELWSVRESKLRELLGDV